MVKVRFSISLDEDLAAQAKAAATEAGLDVSAFASRALRAEITRQKRIAEIFAEIDAKISAAEAEGEALPWPPEPIGEPLSEEEAAEIEARWDRFFRTGIVDSAE